MGGGIKTFSDKQELVKFVIIKPSLNELLEIYLYKTEIANYKISTLKSKMTTHTLISIIIIPESEINSPTKAESDGVDHETKLIHFLLTGNI